MKLPLVGGFYQARSIIAGAQRCVCLYTEKNQEDAPFPFTNYPTPGLTLKLVLPTGPMRGLYTTGSGAVFGVGGNTLYSISPTYVATGVGTISTSSAPVSMSDNGLVLLLVDGSANGYYVDLTNGNTFGQIKATAFYGANHVDEVDGFFVLNQPATANWYASTSLINAALIVGGAVVAGTITGGFGYTNGVHASVPLTGGSGEGATADITVSGNAVTLVVPDSGTISAAYQVGDVLSAEPVSLGGAILGQSTVGGVGYTNGTYSNVPFTGGTGSLAQGTVTVAGGVVTGVVMTVLGQDYSVGDSLTASAALIGGTGTGFAITVTAVNEGGAGFTYTVTEVDAGSLAFDPLDIASKSGSADLLQTLIAIHREVHLYGQKTSEVWYDAGSADFTFGELPGVFYENGCAAIYSVAKADLNVFWLGQNKQGKAIVFMEGGYSVKQISTHAIENVIQGYAVISDAIGFTYQIQGHVFYVLTFPTADATWVYDASEEMWHEWVYTDNNGLEHRHRANCYTFGYGEGLVGDWQNGNIYALDINNYTDNGQPIIRRRGFMHLQNEGKRLSYDRFWAEMATGESSGTSSQNVAYAQAIDLYGNALTADSANDAVLVYRNQGPANVSLRYSDDRGRTFKSPITIPVGGQGEFGHYAQRRQLGLARDRVFELFWSGAWFTALSGAYVDVTPSET